MSAPFSNEDAEVRVGVAVRPLRGHWRPVGSQTQTHLDDLRNMLDPTVWRTAHDSDNEAKMLFTSKMVYSNHKLNGGDSAATEVEMREHSHQPMAPISKTEDKDKSGADSVLVSRCPSSCKCGASSTAVTVNSPPPESNRIRVPPELDEEKDVWNAMEARAAGKKKASTPQVWAAKSKAKSGRSTKEDEDETPNSGGSVSGSTGSSLGKGTSRRSDSSDEIKVTISPLPKQQKPTSRGPDKNEKGRGSVPEKPSPLKDDKKMKPAPTPDKTPKESEQLRVKFDLQDPSKGAAKKNALAPGRDSRPTSPKRISASTSSGTETPETRGQETPRQEKNRPILQRAKLTTLSRSRLKTVTYKEEPFMSEFKSWVLLIIFLSMIWLYRSTLFS